MSKRDFHTLDSFMLVGFEKLIKNKSYSDIELANSLLKAFPHVPWSSVEIVQNLTKFVRIGSLRTRPCMNGNKFEYHYIIE